MYNIIINPMTNKKISIYQKQGHQIIQKYCKMLKGGANKEFVSSDDIFTACDGIITIGDVIPSNSKKGEKSVVIQPQSCLDGNTGKQVFTGAVLTAKNYKDRQDNPILDPTGWWVSEKWDGYRAIWDGSKFVSRNGKDFNVPRWFSALMPPSVSLDGELWVGRGCYEQCGIFKKKKIIEQEWIEGNIKFNVFDIPSLNKPFEERIMILEKMVKDRCSCMIQLQVPSGIINVHCPLSYTPQILVKSYKHLDKMFEKVVKQGGEGLMIRKPGSMYEKKRSSTLLKYKVLLDTECKVVGYKPGTGKYNGLLGSFECQLLKGNQRSFYASGMTDEIRNNYRQTHPVGTILTIIYNGMTKNGIPRHPRYLRKRSDHGL